MKRKIFFETEPVSERHPEKMSVPNPPPGQDGGNQFMRIMEYLKPFYCIELKSNDPTKTFNYLRLFDESETYKPVAIIINNYCQCNRLILLDKEADRFYFGFDMDGSLTSKEVFPYKKAKGTDFSIVNERFIVIVRNFETFNSIRNLLNSSQA